MNVNRVAALLRELADAIEEKDEEAPSVTRKPRPRKQDLTYPAPTGPVSDIDRQRARRMLRRRGIHT